MSTVLDYIGRTIDLLAYQGVTATSSAIPEELIQSLVDDSGLSYITTGIEKLAQRVLIVLLTKQGSMLYNQTAGTTFMIDAQSGIWRTIADVELSFHAAKLDLVRQIRAQALDTDPLDEQLVSIEFISASLLGDQAAISLQLVSAAGTSFEFIAPLPLMVR